MKLKFTDGMEIETGGGEYTVIAKSDGLYVVGRGMCCPVNTREEGDALIKELTKGSGK
jgi:hypothetical protein